MDFTAARATLDRLPRFEVKPGLARVAALLERLGHPERAYPAVHVAGTNGKGSVVAMLDAVLRCAGYRVGRYTSPEVVDFRDRIVVDGRWLSEEAWADGVERLAPILEGMDDEPAQFEAITALAFDAFARASVDLAVVEVGLGGRFDATNVVRPVLSILTNVALDHTALLGDSIERIAWEKVGIAKPGVPLLIGPLASEALGVAEAEARAVGTRIVRSSTVDVSPEDSSGETARYRVVDGRSMRIELALLGGYQLENLRIVLRAIELLREGGFDVPDGAIAEGLRTVSWPGRFEVVRREPTVILDGAHNEAGARALAADIARFAGGRSRRRLLFGAFADKDVAGMLRALAPLVSRVALAPPASPRALPVAELERLAEAFEVPHACYDSVKAALASELGGASPRDVWFVAGSLCVVAEARRFLEGGG
jgi:dihydrofolate synthase/folylpolyglutamate synthase